MGGGSFFVQCLNGQLMRPDSQLYIVLRRRRGAAFSWKYAANEFLAQLFAEWALARLFIQSPIIL